jgi:hypothetical protein
MFLLTNGNDTIDFKTAVTDILLKKMESDEAPHF